ncbi:hypothetical protein ABZ484_35525 [Streptomyces sp. NPDC006393]|uniref:hypothetical protein n=1 Tax=Streptomyces sp. NPDC006393 TaxID=3156763 RepID=UPI0033EC5224
MIEESGESDEDTDAHSCFPGMPGLCWGEIPKRYAKMDSRQGHEDRDAEGRVLRLVHAYPGGVAQDPHWDLSDELPPDFDGRSLRGLTVLVEAARRKLDTETWDTYGPWRLSWSSCESDVTDPQCEGEDCDSSDDDLDHGESDAIRYLASIDNEGDVPALQITGARWGEWHVFYSGPVSVPGGEPLDTASVEGLRTFLERATEQVSEAGYEMEGEWTLDWSHCYVRLAG